MAVLLSRLLPRTPAWATAAVPRAVAVLPLLSALPPANAPLESPMAVALLLTPTAWAMALAPKAIAPLNCPLDVAVAPAPDATAKLPGVLLQPVPALMPLIDAHVALTLPAPASADI